MNIELYLVFVVATAILIATPGPNVALIVGTSLRHGARTGLIAMAGVNLGVMVQLIVVAAGLSWIVELFAKNFDLIRFVGAAYLLFLGIQTLWKSRGAVAGAPVEPLSANRAFGRGLAVAFANPEDTDLSGGVPAAVPDGTEKDARRSSGCSRRPSGSSRSSATPSGCFARRGSRPPYRAAHN